MEAIWNANPDVNVLFAFEDGNCFVKLSDAVAYKRTTQMDYTRVERPKEEVTEEIKETKPKKQK